MKISEETVQHIAHLSRLRFDGSEVKEIQQDLENIVSFMDKLSGLDTTGVEPLMFMSEEVNVLREDVSEVSLTSEDALRNAPKKDSDYFRIPKVLDK